MMILFKEILWNGSRDRGKTPSEPAFPFTSQLCQLKQQTGECLLTAFEDLEHSHMCFQLFLMIFLILESIKSPLKLKLGRAILGVMWGHQTYGTFHLNWEVEISEFWNAPWSRISYSENVGRISSTLNSKSKMAALHINSSENCSNILFLIGLLSYLYLIKSVVHTVLSNLYVWTFYGVYTSNIPRHALLSTDIANSG